MEIKVINIDWDTDGDQEALKTLPKELVIPNKDFEDWLGQKFSFENYDGEEELLDDICDFLSDHYGYCHNGIELEEPIVFPKQNYRVTVTDSATYIIRAASEKEARDQAFDYFAEREPSFEISKTDEQAEVEV